MISREKELTAVINEDSLDHNHLTQSSIKKSSNKAFSDFMADIVKQPEKYISGEQDAFIKGLQICECCCQNESHKRSKLDNSRTKIENQIIEQVNHFSKEQKIEILSLGSGGLLQDLMNLFRLILSGYKQISITLVEPETYSEAKNDFLCFINRINQLSEIHIECTFYKSIAEICQSPSSSHSSQTASKKYDIIYAIDYDALNCNNDFSKRDLPQRQGYFYYQWITTTTVVTEGPYKGWNNHTSTKVEVDHKQAASLLKTNTSTQIVKDDHYTANIDLIKSFSLLQDNANAFCAVSSGRYLRVIKPTPQNQLIYNETETHQIQSPNLFSKYIINANIGFLLFNLSFLMKENKSIIINENIILPEDKPYLENFLKRFRIQYSFYSTNNEIKRLTSPEKLFCVLDGIPFDTTLNEKAIMPPFDKENVTVVRYDFRNPLKNADKNATECYPCPIESQVKHVKYDNQLSKLLNASCSINRIKAYFFPETLTLSDYLIDLAKENQVGISKAQCIINALSRHDYAAAKEVLLQNRFRIKNVFGTTGSQIWSELEKMFPEIVQHSDNLTHVISV